MNNRNENENNLPDTQRLESQDIYSDESQSIYTDEEECLQTWAKLTYIPTKRLFGKFCWFFSFLHLIIVFFGILELRHNESWFGRDNPSNNDKVDVWIFNNQNCSSKYLERISKCHFQIEREAFKNEDKDKTTGVNLNPAFITCNGRNGLYINDEKMSVGERRILVENDAIKLAKNYKLFIFQYQNIPPEYHTLKKECVKKYYIGRIIGSGGCGIVRLCVNVKTFEKFAMKVIVKAKNTLSVRDTIAHNAKILNEVKIMKSLSNPHVLTLVDSYESTDNVVIIMEYLEGKDMLHRITQHTPGSKRLSEMDAKFFFLQACRGLKYLHENYITHRDIKPDNILLQSLSTDTVLKISDFGLSKLIATDSMKTVCGTLLYVAPEIYDNKNYTNKVDIWSLGCVLFAMLSGSVPFSDAYGPPDCKTQILSAKFSFRRNRCWNDVSNFNEKSFTFFLIFITSDFTLSKRTYQKNAVKKP